MTDDLGPIVRGIQKRFRDFSVDVREERLIRYVVSQLRLGRKLDDIFQDAYLTSHTTEAQRAQILENPELIKAIKQEIHHQFPGLVRGGENSAERTSCGGSEAAVHSQRDTSVAGNEGERAGESSLFCRFCGTDNTSDSNFCRHCGARLRQPEAPEVTMVFSPGEQDTGSYSPPAVGRVTGTVLLIRAGGGREGETVPLVGEVLTIGRSPHSDLFLDDVTVSRHHARIIREANAFLVEDLNSLNGTYVNRRRIERHLLTHGDELQIGKFKLAFLEREETS